MTVQDQLNSVITNFNNLLKIMTENFNFLSTTKANNSDVVHKTGDETVTGTKTFSNTIVGSVNGNANTATNDIDGNPIKTTYQKVSNLSQVINESTTKYPSCNAVKTAIDAKDSLPSQAGNAGKFLTTDGTNASWENSYTPPLLSCMWSDHLLSDMSWLRADTFSWQDGTTYSLIYNELLSEYNNSASTAGKEGSIIFKRTPKGYKIANATQENAILNKYNSDGIAWCYILDTTNQRFKLPRTKFGFEGLRTSVGDDISESLPNINIISCGIGETNSLFHRIANYPTSYLARGDGQSGLITEAFASLTSSTYQDGAPVQERATQMYLYFYVGNFTESAEAQTAGLNSELFNNKLDLNANNLDNNGKSLISGLGMPSAKFETQTVGASGAIYIAPANGWYCGSCVEGGIRLSNQSANNFGVHSPMTVWSGGKAYIPCQKGNKIAFEYAGTTKYLTFYYAEGGTTSGGTSSGGTTSGGTTSGGSVPDKT